MTITSKNAAIKPKDQIAVLTKIPFQKKVSQLVLAAKLSEAADQRRTKNLRIEANQEVLLFQERRKIELIADPKENLMTKRKTDLDLLPTEAKAAKDPKEKMTELADPADLATDPSANLLVIGVSGLNAQSEAIEKTTNALTEIAKKDLMERNLVSLANPRVEMVRKKQMTGFLLLEMIKRDLSPNPDLVHKLLAFQRIAAR